MKYLLAAYIGWLIGFSLGQPSKPREDNKTESCKTEGLFTGKTYLCTKEEKAKLHYKQECLRDGLL
jgi:hypothetical protein